MIINKSDYTGEETAIEYIDNKIIIEDIDADLAYWSVSLHPKDPEIAVVENGNCKYLGFFLGGVWLFEHNGIERSNENLAVAFAQMLFNLE